MNLHLLFAESIFPEKKQFLKNNKTVDYSSDYTSGLLLIRKILNKVFGVKI